MTEVEKYKLEIALKNLEDRCLAIENAFIDYTENFPKSSEQWIEQRMRALEHQVGLLVRKVNIEEV